MKNIQNITIQGSTNVTIGDISLLVNSENSDAFTPDPQKKGLKTKDELKRLLIDNKIEAAISYMRQINKQEEKEKEFIVLLSRIQELNSANRMGSIHDLDKNLELNKIRVSVAELIDSAQFHD